MDHENYPRVIKMHICDWRVKQVLVDSEAQQMSYIGMHSKG